MSRRYGAVVRTHTGWVEEDTDGFVVYETPDSPSMDGIYVKCRGNFTSTFEPRTVPIIFTDGDVIRYRTGGVRVRIDGEWYAPGSESSMCADDDAITSMLRAGSAVRLVPDVKP